MPPPLSPPPPALRRLLNVRVWGRWLTRWAARRSIHQDTTLTWRNRYPLLFAGVRDLLGARGAHHILSFGCAAGEEVLSLRDTFPDARIVGAEINRVELAACRRLPVDRDIRFIRSDRARIAALGPYDAIFCMAVLQRRPEAIARAGTTDIAAFYPPARFADEILFLSDQLRPGGLLIVEHAQYRVEDVADRARLTAVPGVGTGPAKGPRFDPAGRLIAPGPVIARIFRRDG